MSVRVAVIQTDPQIGRVKHNLDQIVAGVENSQADLAVLPECALTGYGFDKPVVARSVSRVIPNPATDAVTRACKRNKRHAIFGLLERIGDRFYNSAVLIGPGGIIGTYRKMHLPFLGVDRFVWPGDLGFPVFDTPIGRIGMLICYDLSFPEAARALKLEGAEIICVPTNWPMAAAVSCIHSPPVRAQENHVWLVTANRVGTEKGFEFRGESRICDPDGRVLEVAGQEEGTIYADIDPEAADRNRIIIKPGQYEIDRIGSRRPDHYGVITDGTSAGSLEHDVAPHD